MRQILLKFKRLQTLLISPYKLKEFQCMTLEIKARIKFLWLMKNKDQKNK